MSKTVMIPTSERRFWECEIGNRKYRYVAGTTQTVPDEVAAIIDQINAMAPAEAPEQGEVGDVWTKTAEGAEWKTPAKELPAVTDADDGKVLMVDGGEWVAAEASGGGGGTVIFDVTATYDDEEYDWAGTTDVPATDVAAAIAAGKHVIVRVTATDPDDTTAVICCDDRIEGVFGRVFYCSNFMMTVGLVKCNVEWFSGTEVGVHIESVH